MGKYKILLTILICICAGFMFYVFYKEGMPNAYNDLFFYLLLLTPILTLIHLIRNKDNEESLFSLWVKLKKKKIKEELEK
mgnify:FL=1